MPCSLSPPLCRTLFAVALAIFATPSHPTLRRTPSLILSSCIVSREILPFSIVSCIPRASALPPLCQSPRRAYLATFKREVWVTYVAFVLVVAGVVIATEKLGSHLCSSAMLTESFKGGQCGVSSIMPAKRKLQNEFNEVACSSADEEINRKKVASD